MRTSILIACGINAPAVLLCILLCFPQPDTVFRFVYLVMNHLFFSPLCSCCRLSRGGRIYCNLDYVLKIICPFFLLFTASLVNTWYRYEDIQEYWIVLRDPMAYGKRELLLLGRTLIELVLAVLGNFFYLFAFRIWILCSKIIALSRNNNNTASIDTTSSLNTPSIDRGITSGSTIKGMEETTKNTTTSSSATGVSSHLHATTGRSGPTNIVNSLPSSPLSPQPSPILNNSITSPYSSPVKQPSPPQPSIPALYSSHIPTTTKNNNTTVGGPYGFLNNSPFNTINTNTNPLDNSLLSSFNPSGTNSSSSSNNGATSFMYPSFSTLIASSSAASSSSSSSVQTNVSNQGLRQRNARQLGVGSNAPAFSQDIYGPSKPRLAGVGTNEDGRLPSTVVSPTTEGNRNKKEEEEEDIEDRHISSEDIRTDKETTTEETSQILESESREDTDEEEKKK